MSNPLESAAAEISAQAHQMGVCFRIQAECVAAELTRPSVLFRPNIAPDGNVWSALYGPNLMEGVAAYGDTPEEAARAFDVAWRTQRTPVAVRMARDEWKVTP